MIDVIRIEGDGFARNTKVFMGDDDITRFVRNMTIRMGVDSGAPVVMIQAVGRVEIPEALRAKLVGVGAKVGPCPYQIRKNGKPVCMCSQPERQGCEWQIFYSKE